MKVHYMPHYMESQPALTYYMLNYILPYSTISIISYTGPSTTYTVLQCSITCSITSCLNPFHDLLHVQSTN